MNINKLQLESDEQILLQVRKHWFILATQIFAIVVVAILPYFLFVAVLSNESLTTLARTHVETGFIVALSSVWLLIMWMTVFNIWTNYYLDVWTITNKRLVVADQRGFFYRTTASFRLDRLQDVEISVDGMLATLLDYGSLELQTAGEERNFHADGLPDPAALKATILKATDVMTRGNTHTHQDGL